MLDGARSVELHGIEAPGSLHPALARDEVGLAEGLEGVTGLEAFQPGLPDHVGEHVPQLGDRDRRGVLGVGEFVATRVRDDQVIPGCHHRVQEELAVLGAPVGVADHLVVHQQVVAVDPAAARGSDGRPCPAGTPRGRAPNASGPGCRPLCPRSGSARGSACPGSSPPPRSGLPRDPIRGSSGPAPSLGKLSSRRRSNCPHCHWSSQPRSGEEPHRTGDGRPPGGVGFGFAQKCPHRDDPVEDLGQQPDRQGLLPFGPVEGCDRTDHPDAAVRVEDP